MKYARALTFSVNLIPLDGTCIFSHFFLQDRRYGEKQKRDY